jgi:hypothetical protein
VNTFHIKDSLHVSVFIYHVQADIIQQQSQAKRIQSAVKTDNKTVKCHSFQLYTQALGHP